MTNLSDLFNQTKIDRREAELLLAFVLKKDRSYVKAHGKDEIDASTKKKFLALTKRRQKNEPIAYLIGSQPFYGRDFIVNQHTLIPRPETEELVQIILDSVGRRTARTQDVIVDVGTGSGCIATTLALELPDSKVIASDVSAQALKVASQNAKNLGAKVEFVKDDLLGKKIIKKIKGYVVVVANLPYLPISDKKSMMPDVAKYEPAKALFVRGDGSSLVMKLLRQISSLCHPERSRRIRTVPDSSTPLRYAQNDKCCSIFLEVDPRQTKKLAFLAHQLFPRHQVSIKKDHCGRERFLIIT